MNDTARIIEPLKMSTDTAYKSSLTAEVAELFCEAQEPLRAALASRQWRGHVDVTTEATDEQLLAAAWADLPIEKSWTPVVWSSATGKWSVAAERAGAGSRLGLDEPRVVAQYKSGWSLERVGAEHGCSMMTVVGVLDKHRVPRRSLSEALQGGAGRDDIRLDPDAVTDLRIRRWVHGEEWLALCARYNLSYTTCRSAGVGLTWAHVPMPEVCVAAMRAHKERAAKTAERKTAAEAHRHFDIEVAKRLYVDERKSLKNVAKAMRCSDKFLRRKLLANNVHIRDKSEAADKKLTDELVWSFRVQGLLGRSAYSMAKQCQCDRETIVYALRGVSWKHVPMPTLSDAEAFARQTSEVAS